jgi:hypothetical protein
VLKLVINRPELQIILEVLERGFDLDELDPKSEPATSSPPCPRVGSPADLLPAGRVQRAGAVKFFPRRDLALPPLARLASGGSQPAARNHAHGFSGLTPSGMAWA